MVVTCVRGCCLDSGSKESLAACRYDETSFPDIPVITAKFSHRQKQKERGDATERVMNGTLEALVSTLKASLLVNRDMNRGDPPRKPGGNHRELPVAFAAQDPIKSTRINGDDDEGEIVDETNLRPYDILCGRGE